MPIRHIKQLTADDFRNVVGQTFKVADEHGLRHWVLKDVETKTMMLPPQSRTSKEGQKIPAKKKLDKKTQDKLAKEAVKAINANLDAIGFKGQKLKKTVHTVTLGFEGEMGKSPMPEGEYCLFNETLGTIEHAQVIHTVRAQEGPSSISETQPLYDVTYTLT